MRWRIVRSKLIQTARCSSCFLAFSYLILSQVLHKKTQKGGVAGAGGSAENKGAGKRMTSSIEGIARWCKRRLLWACGAVPLIKAEHEKKLAEADERRKTALAEHRRPGKRALTSEQRADRAAKSLRADERRFARTALPLGPAPVNTVTP